MVREIGVVVEGDIYSKMDFGGVGKRHTVHLVSTGGSFRRHLLVIVKRILIYF